MMERTYYPVQTRDRNLIHVMDDGYNFLGVGSTGSTPIGFLAPPKKTLCGQVARRNVSDIFGFGDVTCEECRRRYASVTA